MSHASPLQNLRAALGALQQNQITAAEFCRQWRTQAAMVERLPPRYLHVMEDMLGRLEGAGLFAEGSCCCSFSREDMHANLATWLIQAEKVAGAA